ncbi:YaaC family protein [Sorangium sp. So ce1128]
MWRNIERLGTVDNLTRIAKSKGNKPKVVRPASLKVRQAIELRRASSDSSALTKPLMLYYSMLNLTRGVMLAFQGDFGSPSHGLRYRAGPTLLECKAEVGAQGTFRTFADSIGTPAAELDNKTYSLRDLFAVIPEMQNDFYLLNRGVSSVVRVEVRAYIRGEEPTTLHFQVPGESQQTFEQKWTQLFPWMADVCELHGPFTLRLKVQVEHEELVAEFCKRFLIHDLRMRDDAWWYDHRAGGGVTLLQRLPAYIAAMFILSNITRYEPEFLDDSTLQLSDLGYFIRAFLDSAERFFPQLILELIHGHPVFFE